MDGHIEGWLSAETKEALRQFLTPDTKLVIEVGSWLGLSTRFILDTAPNARIICIDTWEGAIEHRTKPQYAATLPVLYDLFLERNKDYMNRIAPIKESSRLALPKLYQLDPDLVYIDGSHEYADVRTDVDISYTQWGGPIVGDDWKSPDVRSGVRDALPPDVEIYNNRKAWWVK